MVLKFNHRKRKLNFTADIDLSKIIVEVPIDESNCDIIKFDNIGDTLLPSKSFGRCCKKNAEGYSYPDKTKPKEYRIINTLSYYPYGNVDAGERYFDVERLCYPRIIVPPTGIELMLCEDELKKQYVIADLQNTNIDNLIVAINILVEAYGYCILTDEGLIRLSEITRRKCNWEILPPGTWPSKHLSESKQNEFNDKIGTCYKERLDIIESCHPLEAVSGKGGFSDYYAYLFDNICVLESAIYANATYIIKKEEWEAFSQMTKYELSQTNNLLLKLFHDKNWDELIKKSIDRLNIK